ncbi:MAG: zf-HC2 domain-containing protein [Acidobacteriota bacterium]
MRCEEFEERLAELSTGQLGGPIEEACRHHAETCPKCSDLLETVRGARPASAPEGLLNQIIQATSGRSCQEARSLLCDHIDGVLPSGEGLLLGHHLESCSECRALTEALAVARDWLPELAVADPGSDFADGVFERTSRLPAKPRRIDAALAYLRSLSLRPRFALEAAYLGALLLFGLYGLLPGNTLHPSILSSSLAPTELHEDAARYARLISDELSHRSRHIGGAVESWAAAAEESLSQRSSAPLAALEGQYNDTCTWLRALVRDARQQFEGIWRGPADEPPES